MKLRNLIIGTSVLGFSVAAVAQSGGNIIKLPVAGIYTFEALAGSETGLPETFASEICWARVDGDQPVELKCDTATPDQVTSTQVTVEITPGHDAVVKAYAKDRSGNKSAFSDKAYILDFTAPPAPQLK